ncbi:hypothetical protein HZA40_01445 [Candidatus Peregrinibacteria bacterium]|nr:hypothetical protein [Candidatus Peregrinibacteria bacterium]
MQPSEGKPGKKAGALASALVALGISGDKAPDASKSGLEDGLYNTRSAIVQVVDVRKFDPQAQLDSLKRSYPQLAAANKDGVLLEIIEALGQNLLSFLDNFGPEALLMLALLYVQGKKGGGMISLRDNPKVMMELEPKFKEAEALHDELDALSGEPDAQQSELLCARVAAVVSGIMITLAPLNAEAAWENIWHGGGDAIEGTTHGIGALLRFIGQIAETLSYFSYVIDIVVLAGIIGLGFKNASSIGKAWRGIANNRLRAGRARDALIGPRVVKAGTTSEGVATRLEARPGVARTAGRALLTAVTTAGAASPRSIIQRLMAGEINVGEFRAETQEIVEVANEILRILDAGYPPGTPFPQVVFDANVARFNALVAGLNGRLHDIPRAERGLNFRDISALIILLSALVFGVGWYKAHYSGVSSSSGSDGGSVVAPPPDIPLIPPPDIPFGPSKGKSGDSDKKPAKAPVDETAPAPDGDGPKPVPSSTPEDPKEAPSDSKAAKPGNSEILDDQL